MRRVRHVLGISGGKDSAALAIYMRENYPELDIEYYTSDTGKELEATYNLIENLENYLGKEIYKLPVLSDESLNPFDHFIKMYNGYLPGNISRWCTKKLKLEPFEKYVGDDLVISYVGIRGDEDREGYISRKSNIQSIFPFRKNMFSEDVTTKFLGNNNIPNVFNFYATLDLGEKKERIFEVINEEISINFSQSQKLNILLDLGVKEYNHAVFHFLKTTDYPLSQEVEFPLVDNEDLLVRDDIFRILEDSGVGVPEYYKAIEFEVNGKKSTYARSRSGCFFCFYQQKIEWVWLYEQHPDLFFKAMEYEKDGYTWIQDESLAELVKSERIEKIKEEYIKRKERKQSKAQSPYLLDILEDAEGEGCASCFI
ncbi:phosphoadenosine phosphosulfate reductase domain-containing protein [Flavobacterium johnsoniae]|uniref:Phosphoadenosine phosphosulfate reductase n=1 Tax=Flavobacterium johnsoniae (strain ATCC 17061 / DSM 2064 / JCM 8514 / BCRC 14874 / CCUG 350202 / NBRC 14942 / NCIMB 11054 / UW101) TaxID=376686 RepID=A5FFI6_FLAJ1|nr:phosphoadenosine phosphosulfate reductase family protein [Flavobacterium johnsoniae]ABQ06032.1 phosphoadenosine phosphosulfate reductase [Flavobacterium johnsoniae UW101]OXG00602.1 phosphoadenosine phosphosulfate reductase [Flavobacterium johnsoniae UW101]WQG81770.1 phosphoadenosine phosphosulfate reductase family protein [Flavobacterium johnsoniae UW101]SHK63751.1 Phosphoadenosine phosphosulfate reductase family protein [Flavobacterium johnsoniae]